MAQSRQIAKGRAIRDVDRLVATYGGLAKNWVKMSSPLQVIGSTKGEIHWYQCHGIGRVEEKWKWLD